MNFIAKIERLVFTQREIEKKMKGLDKKTREYKELDIELKKNTKKWNELVNARQGESPFFLIDNVSAYMKFAIDLIDIKCYNQLQKERGH